MSQPEDSGTEPVVPSEEQESFRQFHGSLGVALKILGAGSGLLIMLYIADIFSFFGVFLYSNQYNAIFLAVVLTLTFFFVPAGKGASRKRLPWYDILLILGSLAGCIYIAINALELTRFGKISANPLELTLGTITVIALIEAVRRSFGWAMVIVVMVFLAYAKFGYLVPGPLSVYFFSWSMLFRDIYLSTESIFGSLTSISSGIIISFITFGVFFIAIGGGEFFLKLALSLTGSMRGGPAKAAIVGSALFGTLSGSPTANVVVTGSITIPMMIRTGYPRYYAGAVEAIASTGGALAPPIMAGIAFVVAIFVGVPYAKIATLAALPAILYFLALFAQVDLKAAKEGLRGVPREQLPPLKATLKEGWEFAIPFVVLVMLLFKLPPVLRTLSDDFDELQRDSANPAAGLAALGVVCMTILAIIVVLSRRG